MARLGGKERVCHKHVVLTTTLHVWQHASVYEALVQSRRQVWSRPNERDAVKRQLVGLRPVDGDKGRLALAVDASHELVDRAIHLDPRLARKAQWVRCDEGEHCDTALLAQGDDQPFYKRVRGTINDETRAGEPLRVVISTDDKVVPAGAAAAFIATVRIVQQFIPVEVWWQGAWLNDPDAYPRKGFVFHVPLVQGDMDFSRLEFCIADNRRDSFSFMVMSAQAVNEYGELWNGCSARAERSYLPTRDSNRDRFVAHTGIQARDTSIATTAAEWLGLEPTYVEQWSQEADAQSALQRLPDPSSTYTYTDTRTAAQKRADEQESNRRWREQERQRKAEAAERMSKV
jgi:hypothetical protein